MYRTVLLSYTCIAILFSQSTGALDRAGEGNADQEHRDRNVAQPMPGQIVIDPEHPQWLKRSGGKHVFICGPGDPEDFLYRGRRNPDGTRSGDQAELIRKLAAHGGNSLYLQIVRSHGGDAKRDGTQNPFVDSDPGKGLDEELLCQWEEWFTLIDQHEILMYLIFYDDGARIWDTGDSVGDAERQFVEAIVNRFKHHKNLIWVVAEESEERYTIARVQAIARVIRGADDHGHPLGNHHLSGTTFKAFMPGKSLDHFAMQLGKTGDEAHAGAIEALAKAAGRYQVIYAESTATPTDVDGMRRHAWSVAMGGLMPLLFGMDIATTPVESLQQCRYLVRFFEAADFYTMSPHDELKLADTQYVLADSGRSYIAYTDKLVRGMGLKGLPQGRCDVSWLDCRTGATLSERQTLSAAGDHVFRKPNEMGEQCAAWIRFPDIRPCRPATHPGATRLEPKVRHNVPPVVDDQRVSTGAEQELYVQLSFIDPDGPGPYVYTVVRQPAHGTLTGDDNDRFYRPGAGFVGTDQFAWKVDDGEATSNVATVTIEVTPTRQDRGSAARYFPPPESQGGWRKLASADDAHRLAGMDPRRLAELKEWLLASDKRNFAAVVIRNGYIVLEVERGNSSATDARRVASVSKAVCATVLAIASQQSQEGLTPKKMTFDDRAFDYIPWAQPLSDPRKAQITVKQLLNHTSGICPEAVGAPNDGSWEYVLGHSGDRRTERLAFDPGTACGYSTHALDHAALVCETVTGKPYDRFAIEALFKPIGIEHWWFQYFDGGHKIGRHPSHGLGMPARDLARIAYCMLRQGRWRDKQVIPRWFVDQTAAATHDVRTPEMRFHRSAQSFSHGWELPARLTSADGPSGEGIPADARSKPGSGGQLMAFVPSLDLVITRQTGASGQWQYEEYLRRACSAVLD